MNTKSLWFPSAALSALGCSMLSTSVLADDTTGQTVSDTSFTIGEVVVTAKQDRAHDVSDVLTSVNILGGDIAQRENVNNAFELFQRVPGVLTTDFNQGTTNGSISMRGFNGEGTINAVKLLIDGVPSNDNAGYTPFLDEIFPLDISRIEVVEGTSDARYGLNNLAGNASIFTRQGGTYSDSQVTGGSFGTYDIESSAGYQPGDFSQNYFASFRHSDGQREHDKSDRWSLGGKWFDQIGDFNVGAITHFYEATAQEPGYLTVAQSETDPNATNAYNADDGDKRKLAQVSLQESGDFNSSLSNTAILYYNYFNDQRFVTFAPNSPQYERETQENHYGGILRLRYAPDVSATMHSLVIEGGGDFQVQSNAFQQYNAVERVRYAQTIDRNYPFDNYGGYVQVVVEPLEWLKITPAYRVDTFAGHLDNLLTGNRYSMIDYGTVSQPKISVAVTLPDGFLLYGNYGRAFQIGLGSSAYLIPPQTNIKPSINDGLEAGLKYKASGWLEARVDVWQQTASGEIQYDELTLQETNLGKTRRRGYDIQVNVKPTSQLDLWLSFNEQRAVILVADPADTGEKAGNIIDHVPQYMVSVGAEYHPTDALRFAFTANGQSAFQLSTANSYGSFGRYLVCNLEAGYTIVPRVELGLQVKNLSNDRHVYAWLDGTVPLTSPADGRSVYGDVRVRF
jgi:iron complex outermembrane recepter protein